MSTAGGTWQVLLGGSFKDYDSNVQQALDAAYNRGEASVDVTVRGHPCREKMSTVVAERSASVMTQSFPPRVS